MTNETPGCRGRGAWPRRMGVQVVMVGIVLMASACGGGPSPAGSAGLPNAGGAATSQSESAQMLPFARCMRSHGLANFPDPSGNGKFPSAQQLGLASSQYQAAEADCQHLLPAGTDDMFPPAEMPLILSGMRKFSQCMRSHGVPDWPDPAIDSAGQPEFPVSSVPGLELDHRLAPQVYASDGECHYLLPAGGGMPLG